MATAQTSRSSRNGKELVDPKLASEFDDQLASLRDDISALTETVKSMATDTGGRVQDTAREAARDGEAKLRESAEKARAHARTAGEDAYSAGREAANHVQANVAQNPFTALALAAGIGFIAGAMAKR